MGQYVLTCLEADFDPATQTCAAPFYTTQPTSFPSLSIADAQQIGMAMAFVLAVAWVFRRVAKAIETFN